MSALEQPIAKAEQIVGLLSRIHHRPVRTREIQGGHELLDDTMEMMMIAEALDLARKLRDELAQEARR